MSCCGTFTSVGVMPASNPSHHVHFSTGMVLGVQDYQQEFAYNSGRHKLLMRELGGYGTIAGLAVSVEDDAEKGPVVRVTSGSAAAPSGEFICVGSDQCGALNPWLAREDIAARVTTIGAEIAPDTAAVLKVWLTLCYTNCAIAPVPIPGQPCRSEEDLMAPSRVADDYILSLSLDPPTMTEAQAMHILETYLNSLDSTGSGVGPADRENLRTSLAKQIDALFSPTLPTFGAGEFAPIVYDPALHSYAIEYVRQYWITHVRPHVMAQKCVSPSAAANDCVLLASLTVPAVNPGGHWEVDGTTADIDKDESDRPFMLSSSLIASAIGNWNAPVPSLSTFAFVTATVATPLDDNIGAVLVNRANATTTTLPAAPALQQRHRIFVRNVGAGTAKLKADATGLINGAAEHELPSGASVMLIADGDGNWRLLTRSV